MRPESGLKQKFVYRYKTVTLPSSECFFFTWEIPYLKTSREGHSQVLVHGIRRFDRVSVNGLLDLGNCEKTRFTNRKRVYRYKKSKLPSSECFVFTQLPLYLIRTPLAGSRTRMGYGVVTGVESANFSTSGIAKKENALQKRTRLQWQKIKLPSSECFLVTRMLQIFILSDPAFPRRCS